MSKPNLKELIGPFLSHIVQVVCLRLTSPHLEGSHARNVPASFPTGSRPSDHSMLWFLKVDNHYILGIRSKQCKGFLMHNKWREKL